MAECICLTYYCMLFSFYNLVWRCVDVSFPSKQPALPAEPVAAYGGAGTVRKGFWTASTRDIHARSQQGVHHVTAWLRRRRPQVP